MWKTTQAIKSLASGDALGAGHSVTPNAFTPERWARLVSDGVVVEQETAVVDLQFDNLTVIRGIGNERQNELTALGIRTFEQLANADASGLERDMEVSQRTINGWQKLARELANA